MLSRQYLFATRSQNSRCMVRSLRTRIPSCTLPLLRCTKVLQQIGALGHSQQMQSAPKSVDVRFTSKATVSHRTAMRRNGPNSDIGTAANSALFDHLVGGDENR